MMAKLIRRSLPAIVDPSSPFREDRLGRSDQVKGLAALIASFDEPHVIAIEGKWGSGKTTFVKMTQALLEADGHACIYFDAWSHDWATDPLVPLIATFESQIGVAMKRGKASKSLTDAMKGTVSAGIKLAAGAAPIALSAVANAVVGRQAVEMGGDLVKSLTKETPRMVERAVENLLKAHREQTTALTDFRRQLTEFATAWGMSGVGRKGPIVVFVDELDRCRPPFAIALLERIKHAFGTEGVVFVLSADQTQLGVSIRSQYGDGIDAEGYLRRFIDIWYALPTPSTEKFIEHLVARLDLASAFSGRNGGNIDLYGLTRSLLTLAKVFTLAPRTIERVVGQVDLAIRLQPTNRIIYPSVLSMFAVLRELERPLLEKYVAGEVGVDGIVSLIERSPAGREVLQSGEWHHIEALLRMLSGFPEDFRTPTQIAQSQSTIDSSETPLKKSKRERLMAVGALILSHHSRMNPPSPGHREYCWSSLQLASAFHRD